MGRLAPFKLVSFHVLCASLCVQPGRSRQVENRDGECVCVCVLHGNLEECRGETLIGKRVENKTCRPPDVSVKAVSAAQVHSEVSEAYTCIRASRRDPGPLSCRTPGFLPPRAAVHLHTLHQCSACSVSLLGVVRFCLPFNKNTVPSHTCGRVKQKSNKSE